MSEQTPISFNMRHEPRDEVDGEDWVQFNFPESHILVTGQGRDFLKKNHLSLDFLRNYAAAVRTADEGTGSRLFLERGANARVYTADHPDIVIKEQLYGGDDLYNDLRRMDLLAHAVQSHCPAWIKMPAHYGIFEYRPENGDREQQFLMMEKIDTGVTVGDVLSYGENDRNPLRGQRTAAALVEIFGVIDQPLKDTIAKQYEEMITLLENAIVLEGEEPDAYLTDIDLDTNPDNVLVEKLNAKIAGKDFRFWVIDQRGGDRY